MPLRWFTRQLLIAGTTTLHLDTVMAGRDQDAARRHRGHIVRVFYLHGTPPSHEPAFRRHVARLQERFNVIAFDTFKRLFADASIDGDDRPAALLTFDDGLANNYEVAARVLEDAGLRGVFFVVPSFSERRGEEAIRFFREHIRAEPTPMGQTAMTPDQVADLAARGHTIGNHTLSHARLSALPPSEYEREIVESAATIERWIGRPVEAFAWPFVWNAITPAAHRIAAARHPYCFAPCAGLTDACRDSTSLIWRTNLEPNHRDAEFRFQVSGLADWISASRRATLSQLLP